MSDEGEKTCPLCAEEMDLTDQQLKPCKCGYEICVWCWHHIMDMAEKDEAEGRCPACRVPYDKEKIVGMAANCERLVAEISMERKKSQKAKTKTPDGRKQLSSVRVIQRNLVYIVGLPLNLADEDLLQRKEYFGKYGKVLKVSISRTAAGTVQHFVNSTCSVYITYSKEEEAVRCIQTVHGFALDGRSLRACFGTTKYCHAWLRNLPCSNPDCLYLHEIGSQEDSFTKDEIISAYTRSRVQQITGATNNVQRRSGNVLPPPMDDFYSNSSASTGKPIAKNATNNLASIVRDSPPNGSPVRSVGLPSAASWAMRASNCNLPAASLPCSNGPSKQKPDLLSGSLPFSSAIAFTGNASKLHIDIGKKQLLSEENHTVQPKGKLETLESTKQCISPDYQTTALETAATAVGPPVSLSLASQFPSPPTSSDNDIGTGVLPNRKQSIDLSRQSSSDSEKDTDVGADEKVQDLCSVISSIGIDKHFGSEHSGNVRSLLTKSPGSGSHELKQYYAEPLTTTEARKAVTSNNGVVVPSEQCGFRLESLSEAVQNACHEVEDRMLLLDDRRLCDSEIINHTTLPSHLLNYSKPNSLQNSEVYSFIANTQIVDRKVPEGPNQRASGVSVVSSGFPENSDEVNSNFGPPYLLPNDGRPKQMGRFEGEGLNVNSNAALDMGESSIISNILSMDFDAWDEPLTSPRNLAKLLGETDKQHGSLKLSSSWKIQNSNQSRFSFARQEESKNQIFDFQPSFNDIGKVPKSHSFNQNFIEARDPHLDKLGNGNIIPSSYIDEPDNFASGHSVLSSNKLSVARAHVSAPPGFSVPNRAPPPGFFPHERADQPFDNANGNRLLDNSSLLRTPYQSPATVNMGSTGDVEFIDPAILAVGKGRLPGGLNNPGLDLRSTVPSQFSAFENEARLQMLMQRSLSPHQSLRFPEVGDNFSALNDAYGISSRLMEQSQTSNLSPFAQMPIHQSRNALMSNGHWDGWNEVQSGNNIGMAELLRNERLGFNKFYTSYEDSKFRMPNPSDLYNRTFGM